jgi:succinate dehydrogenase / fumarate reductase cytochrome b subunit
VYGILITAEARPNNLNYPYPRNWFYTVQRLTGIILFFFITFHVLNFRFGLIPHLNNLSVADNPGQAFAIVSREFRMVPIFIIYVVGIAATVWHLANGIWLFLVDWGITIGERAQRLTGYACIAFGVLLLAVGINAAVAFIRPGGLLGGIL